MAEEQTEKPRNVLLKLFGHVGLPDDNKEAQNGYFTLLSVAKLMDELIEGDDDRRKLIKPIFLVSSFGGIVEEGLRIYNYLAHLPLEVTTVGVGMVDSAATIVYLAGKKRLATPATRFVFHESRRSIRGASTHDIKTTLRYMKATDKTQAEIIAKATGNGKQAGQWLRGENIFDAEQAKQYGVVHEVVTELFSGETFVAERLNQPDYH